MIHMQETEEKFIKYPSVSKAQQIESIVDGMSIDYGYHSSSGTIHEFDETEEDRLANPY